MSVVGKWILFADDNPIPQREEEITKLAGGGKVIQNCYEIPSY